VLAAAGSQCWPRHEAAKKMDLTQLELPIHLKTRVGNTVSP